MTKQNMPSKTLGPRSALLVTTLHERGRPIFTLADAQNITGLKGHLRADLGPQAGWSRGGDAASAWGLPAGSSGTRPRTRIPWQPIRRSPRTDGTQAVLPFACVRNGHPQHGDAAATRRVRDFAQGDAGSLSPRDGIPVHPLQAGTLFRDDGPLGEQTGKSHGQRPGAHGAGRFAAAGILRRSNGSGEGPVDSSGRRGCGRLVEYALRLNVGAVMRRLGFLMEVYDLGTAADRERLRGQQAGTYSLLDPVMPPQGKHAATVAFAAQRGPRRIPCRDRNVKNDSATKPCPAFKPPGP